MRVSSSCRVWSSSDRTTIFASSACSRTSQPSTVRQSQAPTASRHGGLHLARRCRETYTNDKAPAEAGAPVEPVVVLELVDLDALAIVGRWRYQCHSRTLNTHSGQGQHALQSVARDRDVLRSAREQLAGAMGSVMDGRAGARWRMTIGRIGGRAGCGRLPQRVVRARATAPVARK
jgi:hypothetical protein